MNKLLVRLDQAGTTHHLRANGESFAIDKSEPGQWTVRLLCASVSPGEPVLLNSSLVWLLGRSRGATATG